MGAADSYVIRGPRITLVQIVLFTVMAIGTAVQGPWPLAALHASVVAYGLAVYFGHSVTVTRSQIVVQHWARRRVYPPNEILAARRSWPARLHLRQQTVWLPFPVRPELFAELAKRCAGEPATSIGPEPFFYGRVRGWL